MSVVRRYSPLNFQETSSLCIRLRLAFVNSLRWGLSPQFKASLPKHLQLLAGCRHMSGSFMYFGIQTVTKYLEICGHRPLKALILEVIFFFFLSLGKMMKHLPQSSPEPQCAPYTQFLVLFLLQSITHIFQGWNPRSMFFYPGWPRWVGTAL